MNIDKELLDKIKSYIKQVYKTTGKIPQFSEIMDKFNVERFVVYTYYRELERLGFFKRNYAKYKIDEETTQKKIENIVEKVKKLTLDDIFVGILRCFMLIVGFCAIIMSVYFTYNWGLEYLTELFSLLLSLTLVIFSVGAFQVFLLLVQNKQIIYSFVFIIVWLIVLIFSMQSTVAYLYNSRTVSLTENAVNTNDINRQNYIYDDLIKREKEKENDLIELKNNLKNLNKLISEFNMDEIEEKKKIYDDTYRKIKDIEKRIDLFTKDLNKIRIEKDKFLSEEKEVGVIVEVERKNFYIWIAGIFNISADILEFVIACFPAIFVDIVAPLSVAVSLFLKKRSVVK